jgi:hypothetical protein
MKAASEGKKVNATSHNMFCLGVGMLFYFVNRKVDTLATLCVLFHCAVRISIIIRHQEPGLDVCAVGREREVGSLDGVNDKNSHSHDVYNQEIV